MGGANDIHNEAMYIHTIIGYGSGFRIHSSMSIKNTFFSLPVSVTHKPQCIKNAI